MSRPRLHRVGDPIEASEPPIQGQRKGFNILHVTLLLVSISTFAAVGISSYFKRPAVTLDHATLLLAKDLRIAQNWATYTRTPVEVHFYKQGDGYEVRDPSGEPIADPKGYGPFQRRYSHDAVFEGLRIDRNTLGASGVLAYDKTGVALEGAELQLLFGGESRTLSVAEVTGWIKIKGLRKPWKDNGL